jgi:integrase
LASTSPKRNLRAGAKEAYIVERIVIIPDKLDIVRTKSSGRYWYVSFYVRGEKRYHRKSLRETNPAAAQEKAIEYFTDVQSRVKRGEKLFAITAKDLVDRFLADEEKRIVEGGRHSGGITAGRFSTIRTGLKRHLVPFLGPDTRLDKITEERFTDYPVYRRKKGDDVSKSTLLNEITMINKVFKFAAKRGLVRPNFTPEFPRIQPNTQPHSETNEGARDAFTLQEWLELSEYLGRWDREVSDEDEKYERRIVTFFLTLLYCSGLRTGELRMVRWSDVHLSPGKTDSSVRIKVGRLRKTGARTAIAIEAKEVFERLRDFSPHTRPEDPLIPDRKTGRLFSRRKLYELAKLAMSKIQTRTGKKLSAYSLRHTYCTLRILEGMKAAALAKVMGMKIEQMQKHYLHLDIEDVRLELVRLHKKSKKKHVGLDLAKINADWPTIDFMAILKQRGYQFIEPQPRKPLVFVERPAPNPKES